MVENLRRREDAPNNLGIDAYSPREIAVRVESIGVTKARLPLFTMAALGIVAGLEDLSGWGHYIILWLSATQAWVLR